MANIGFLKPLFYEDLPYIAYLSLTFQFFFRGNFENSTPLQLKTQRGSSGHGNNFNPSTTSHSILSLAISKMGADVTFYLRVNQNFHAVQNSLQNKHQFARKTKNVSIIAHTE